MNKIEQELDRLMIARGEHPSRVRNPLYGEERYIATQLAEFAHNAALSEAIDCFEPMFALDPTKPESLLRIFDEMEKAFIKIEGLKIKP